MQDTTQNSGKDDRPQANNAGSSGDPKEAIARSSPTMTEAKMNRRDANRVSVTAAYSSVAVTAEGSSEPLNGHVYDISEKGLRFEVDRALPIGSSIELELIVPPEESIRVTARVVRVFDEADDPGPRRMGAEFTGFVTAEDEARLDGLLDSFHLVRAA